MGNFYQKFYQQTVRASQILEVFQSWLESNPPEDTPCLEFILDEPPPLSPFEMVTIIGVDIPQELLRLRFRVVRGKWNEDEWEEIVPIAQLPQVVGEFLGILDPEDKCIYIQSDPLPCKFEPIDPHSVGSAHNEHDPDSYPEVETGPRSYGPAVEIPVDEE
jgi:hypothetical protein